MKHSFIRSCFRIEDIEFFSKYWEQRPIHAANSNATSEFNQVFTENFLQALLHERKLTKDQLRLTSTKTTIPHEAYCNIDGSVNDQKLFYYFNAGATIVIKNIEFHFPDLRQLLENFSPLAPPMKRTFVNLYLTPANAQGFYKHYDTQEVIIIQIIGKKLWTLTAPTVDLPVETHAVPIEDSGEVLGKFELNAGDALYMPRGIYHFAETTDSISCHLTFSYVPVTWADLAVTAAIGRITKDVRFRRSFFTGDDLISEIILSREDILNAISNLLTPLQKVRSADFNGFFEPSRKQTDLDTRLRRTGVPYSFEIEEASIHCVSNQFEYRFPVEAQSIIESLDNLESEIAVKDIPTILDKESTILIIEKLRNIRFVDAV